MLDHLRRGTLDLSAVRFAVLDEADEMLDMGFIDDVEAILSCMPGAPAARNQAPIVKLPEGLPPVQIALFSATMPAPIVRLSTRFMRNPEHISFTPSRAMVPQITQVAYDLGGMEKGEALGRILDVEAPGPTIVFCATRRAVDDIAERLHGRGYRTAGLHGDMAQAERQMRRMQGIVDSMTPQERSRPELIKPSRKRRIATGAGAQVQEVNRLLNQFEQMQTMMKRMQKGGMAKMMRGLKGAFPGMR